MNFYKTINIFETIMKNYIYLNKDLFSMFTDETILTETHHLFLDMIWTFWYNGLETMHIRI